MSGARLTVVLTTYEWPEALDVALRSLLEEGDDDFEVLVADDGSGPGTRAVVRRWQERVGERVGHVWQPDEGFRLARVRDLAALEARGDYLVLVDGDCLVRRGFAKALRRAALPGWFLASKRLNLSESLSRRVLTANLPVWRWSAAEWLVRAPREVLRSPREPNRPGVLLPLRDRRRPWRPDEPDFEPPFSGYGYFLGIHKRDLERVNGFDLRFVGWGEEDTDLTIRLRRLGMRCGWAGPRTTLLHLWHPARKETSSRNLPLLRGTEADEARVEAVAGLRELEAELAQHAARPTRS
jgi:glycosyltransferase involved in cell wall biosynthesis